MFTVLHQMSEFLGQSLMIFIIQGFWTIVFIFIVIFKTFRLICSPVFIRCLNFWDKAWWFLSFRVFGLLSSSLLLYSKRFGQYVLRPSSGVWISETKLGDFYHSRFSDYCLHLYCFIQNVSADMSTGLLHVSEFQRQNLKIFIIQGFRTIVFIFIVIFPMFRPICTPAFFRCLDFWNETWFLSFRVFGLFSSPLLLYSQRLGRSTLRSFSGVSFQTLEPTQNFEPRPLFNPRGSIALITLTIT